MEFKELYTRNNSTSRYWWWWFFLIIICFIHFTEYFIFHPLHVFFYLVYKMEIAAVQPQAVTDIVVKPKEKKNVSPIVQDVSIPFISRQKLRKQ